MKMKPSLITVEERQRTEIDPLALEELKTSIKKFGQLQPIGVVKNSNRLVWGERRLRACKELEIEVKAVWVKGGDEIKLAELELEENLRREDLSPLDLIMTRDRLHMLYMSEADEKKISNWGLRESAERMGIKKSILQRDTKSAIYITAAPEQFLGHTGTKSEIEARIRSITQKVKFRQLHDNLEEIETQRGTHISGISLASDPEFSPQSFQDKTISEKIKEIENDTSILPEMKKILIEDWKREHRRAEAFTKSQQAGGRGGGSEEDQDKESFLATKIQSYNQWLRIGDCFEELNNIKDGVIDIGLLDPLWGIEYDLMIDGNIRKGKKYGDTLQKFYDEFEILCKLMYLKMAKHSHLYCFFSITHFPFVYQTLYNCGFEVNLRPIIVCKQGIHATRQPSKWPGAGYEPVAFARKGTRDLVVKGSPDWFSVPWISHIEKKGNPFAKPPQVYTELIRRSAHPGDLVVDPMFGSGAAFVACEMLPELNLKWIGWDKEESNKEIALMNLTEFLMKGDLDGTS